MSTYCGIDWSENHHDVALVDSEGKLLVHRRMPDSATGLRDLLELLAEHGDTADAMIPVAPEDMKRGCHTDYYPRVFPTGQFYCAD